MNLKESSFGPDTGGRTENPFWPSTPPSTNPTPPSSYLYPHRSPPALNKTFGTLTELDSVVNTNPPDHS